MSSQSWLSTAFKDVYQALLDYLLSDLPLMLIGVGVIAAAAVVAVVVWHLQRAFDRREKRMIVASLIIGALIVDALLLPLAVVVGFTPYRHLVEFDGWWETWKYGLRFVAVLIPFLPLAVKAVAPRLRSVLDLVYDVATHFRPRSAGAPDSVDPYPIRAAIRGRVAAVVRYFAARAKAAEGEVWNLVIVSHSQGTMAVLSFLNDAVNGPPPGAFKSLRLVTMGSPFSHIYQHYFQHHYPSLDDPERWGPLHQNLDPKDGKRWLNVYRVDDYVGRNIEGGKLLVDDEPVKYFGHTDHWSDGVVMDVLARKNMF